MALDKAIKHNKEKRKPYRGAKAIDSSCRNHGDCPWCKGNRRYRDEKRVPAPDPDDLYSGASLPAYLIED